MLRHTFSAPVFVGDCISDWCNKLDWVGVIVTLEIPVLGGVCLVLDTAGEVANVVDCCTTC